MNLTDRDIDILRAIYRFRFLRSSHIADLDGGSRQQMLRRLRLLYDHGYVDRIRTRRGHLAHQPSEPVVYGLARNGAAVLAERDALSIGRLDWTAKNTSAGTIFIEHTLMIADIIIGFELACRDHSRLRLIDEAEAIALMPQETQQARQPTRWEAQVKIPGGGTASVALMPDRAFSIAVDEEMRMNFLLEADRGTMRISSNSTAGMFSGNTFARKIHAYHAGWRAGYHEARYGWRNFRVLTVTTSAERVEHMGEAVRAATGGRRTGMFLFGVSNKVTEASPLNYLWHRGCGSVIDLKLH